MREPVGAAMTRALRASGPGDQPADEAPAKFAGRRRLRRAGVAHVAMALAFLGAPAVAGAETERVVDVPSRPGVVQRLLVLSPDSPKAAVVLFAGGHGGLQIGPDGRLGWGGGNFLVRSRGLFASHGLLVAVIDAPSDKQQPPFLAGSRQRPEHVADVRAVIAWLKAQAAVPVWLVGTSRGTQSAAFIGTALAPSSGGPDGLVLTSTVLSDPRGRPVPAMPLKEVRVPVLLVHHRLDGCEGSRHADVSRVLDGLTAAPRKELFTFEGGISRGDPCEAWGYHGYHGIEHEVLAAIAAWIAR